MRNFGKKIITLFITSAIITTCSFAAGNYKNSLMALDLEQGTNGAITVILQTKNPYESNINLVKRDATTYIIMLPEFNSNAQRPNFIGINGISDIKIDTRPYVSNSNGYTKITIITNGKASIFPQSKVFVPNDNDNNVISDIKTEENSTKSAVSAVTTTRTTLKTSEPTSIKSKKRTYEEYSKQKRQNFSDNKKIETTQNTDIQSDNKESLVQENYNNTTSNKNYREDADNNVSIWSLLLLLGAAIAAICLIIIGKNKMSEIVGNSININFNDEDDKPKKSNIQQKSVQKKITISSAKNSTSPKPVSMKKNTTEQVFVEKMNVIDMDELFNAQSSTSAQEIQESSESNDNLEDFLSNYYEEKSEEAKQKEIADEEQKKREELYNSILDNNSLKFTENDVNKIKRIINTELTDEIKQKVINNAVTKPNQRLKEERKTVDFENIIADYFTKQNITFNSEDMKIIHKIMSVELDQDFITDLRTNIKKDASPKFKSITEPIISAEGTFTKNANVNKKVNQPITALSYETQDNTVSILKVEADLPNLQDVLAHPEKYEEPEPEVIVPDENALLKSLSNVQFKPFYDGENSINTADSSANDFEYNETVKNDITYSIDKEQVSDYENYQEINTVVVETPETVTIDDDVYNIKSTAAFNSYSGCYLAQSSNGYAVLGYVREKISKLKEYDTLKSEKISVRINETFENDNVRYLVKIGLKKFVADFDGSNITYVMDLC